MFNQNQRDYSVVNFYMSSLEEGEYETVQCPLDFLPRVGDTVSCYSHRDSNGNYMNAGRSPCDEMIFREVIRGQVINVNHIIEERGTSPRDHTWVQYVDIYLRKVDDVTF